MIEGPDISIDVDGVAPGYAAGVLSQWLTANGFADHLVEIGGEMRASGHRPDGGGWRVGIEAPEMLRGRIEHVIAVSDTAVTTAGGSSVGTGFEHAASTSTSGSTTAIMRGLAKYI